MKINSIYLHALRNNGHFQFMTDVSTLLKTLPAEVTAKFKSLLDTFAAAIAEEDLALKKIMKSVLTSRINEADVKRDNVFRGMVDYLKSMKNHFLEAVRISAQNVGNTADSYGNVTKLSHTDETAALTNLIKDLQTKHAEDVITLGLEKWLPELNKLNKAVEDMLMSRVFEASVRPTEDVKEVRRRTDEAYKNITVCLEAMSMIETPENIAAIETMIAALNNDITRYSNSIAIRKGQAAAKKEDDDMPEEEEIPDETPEEQP